MRRGVRGMSVAFHRDELVVHHRRIAVTHTRMTTQERRTYRRQLRELVARLSSGVAQLGAETLRPAPGADWPADEMPLHEADRAVREAGEDGARTLLVS